MTSLSHFCPSVWFPPGVGLPVPSPAGAPRGPDTAHAARNPCSSEHDLRAGDTCAAPSGDSGGRFPISHCPALLAATSLRENELTDDRLLGRLRTELEIARALLDEVKASARRPIVRSFSEMLLREKVRAERYRRNFAVLVLISDRGRGLKILKDLRNCLRASDLIGVVDGDDGSCLPDRLRKDVGHLDEAAEALGRQIVGAILPETDRTGARIAAGRLGSALAGLQQFRIGTAVYPDDTAELGDLLAIAAAGASDLVPDTPGHPDRVPNGA